EKKIGDAVKSGDALCTVHYNADARLKEATAMLEDSFVIREQEPPRTPLVRFAGHAHYSRPRLSLLYESPRHPPENRSLGPRASNHFCIHCSRHQYWPRDVQLHWRGGRQAPFVFILWLRVRFREPRHAKFQDGLLLCISSSAHDHFHRGAFRGALLLRRDAVYCEAGRESNDQADGRQRR